MRTLLLGTILLLAIHPLGAEELPIVTSEVERMVRTLAPGLDDLSKVDDADASEHRAVEVSTKTGDILYWHNYRHMEPGEYIAAFRLKVSANTSEKVLFDLFVENGSVRELLRPKDFRAAGKYQTFEFPFKLQRPTLVSTPIRGYAAAGVSGWADKVTVTMTRRYGDDEQLRLLGFKPRESFRLPEKAAGVLLVRGVYHEFWQVPAVIRKLDQRLQTSAVYADSLGPHLRAFPESLDELAAFRLLVLADVPSAAFSIEMRAMIEAYVTGGGGLLVLGGPYSFGLGDYDQSDILRRVLPVVMDKHYDMVKDATPLAWRPIPAWSWNADQHAQPSVLYRHHLAAKPGAEVFVSIGDAPLIVGNSLGTGRVAVILATPLGELASPATAWWEWPGWPELLERIIRWTLAR